MLNENIKKGWYNFINDDKYKMYILSKEDDWLLNLTNAKIMKEHNDGQSLLNIVAPNSDDLRSKLYGWAGLGFPPIYKIYSYTIEIPLFCSDGQTRQLMSYIDFCMKTSFNDKLVELQTLLVGIHIDLIISDPNIIIIAVSKI